METLESNPLPAQSPVASPLVLEARGISKSFPGVRALRNVSLGLARGEVLALLGENGAGKSTLMKILAGVQSTDSGQILIDGQPVTISSVRDALRHGVALIHQELNLADNLDLGANIFLGREPRRFGFLDKDAIRRNARTYLRAVGLDLSPDVIVGSLTVGKQQLVEIAKALSINARVLIMDEPTSSLSKAETDRLFEVIRELKSQGVSIIYISHRLGEVKALADRVCVLRDGCHAGELSRADISHAAMVRLMVGRDVAQYYSRRSHAPGDVVLEAVELRTTAFPQHPLSFSLRQGEIVGIAGLVGAGRTELVQTLFGVRPAAGGLLQLHGQTVSPRSCRDLIARGMALAPEDRKQQGLVLGLGIDQNIGLPGLARHRRWGMFCDPHAEQQAAISMIDRLRIKTPSRHQPAKLLSGGNQQKVVLGKWLALGPKILLLDEPTRGIDVGAKQEIYKLMEELAEQGMAILFVSSELEEILGMADRVLVLHEGRLTGELPRSQLSEEAIMRLAVGGEE